MNAAAAASIEHSVVLVVEDEEASRETLRELLELEGYEVETAANGQEALEKIDRFDPCVVLLDLFMPIMDGWQVLDRLRADGRLARLTVVVTTSAETRMPTDVAVFHKPLDFDKLLRAVVAAC
jgi:two-component system response regulator MprA